MTEAAKAAILAELKRLQAIERAARSLMKTFTKPNLCSLVEALAVTKTVRTPFRL